MDGVNDRYEFSDNAKSFFNRSLTIDQSNDFLRRLNLGPSVERTRSIKKTSFGGSMVSAGHALKGTVKKLCNLFESTKSINSIPEEPLDLPSSTKLKPTKSFGSDLWAPIEPSIRLPGTENRVVVYFTSLRGVRRTFEDCYAVRMILRGFRVMVDERDISMDSAYKKELQSVLGEKHVTLPQVFIRGKYVGGADLFKQLHETGELAKILKGLPVRAPGYICGGCGDVRFIPCWNCNGSRKVFDEEEDQLKKCPECNENGLIRCPTCNS